MTAGQSSPGATVARAVSPEAVDAARRLFQEYARSLGFDLCFQDFDRELAELPGEYAPPDGVLLLARVDGRVAGCVGLRRLEAEICEMKRLYVQPAFRGSGVGRALVSAVLAEARVLGYRRMRLDTVPWQMHAAVELYRTFGFRHVEPYRLNPIPGAVFMELDLVGATVPHKTNSA